ncbi:MAG: sporulation transcriptional regulator SpoIIID [Christensenellaceae bacterium]
MQNSQIFDEAIYIITKQSTIRETAKAFAISKSTVHKHLSKDLKEIDDELYVKVKTLLDKNFQEKHIRGGLATKKKYSRKNM